jgi:ABC-type hemin transport system ATPase subunit
MENDLILKAQDLNVELDRRRIIEHLSFTVKGGDVVIILGPNRAV